jgi:hypothetical protein
MTVHVDQMVTEVSVDTPAPAGAPDATGQNSMWAEQAKFAALRARMLRDELRTRATGYDD